MHSHARHRLLLIASHAATLGTLTPASAVTVTFDYSYVGHGAISSWNGSFSNATMDSRPDIMPFVSPDTGAVRYTGNHPVNLVVPATTRVAGVYTLLDGVGTTETVSLGTNTSAFGSNRSDYSITSHASGSRLPVAGATGTLTAPLTLPNSVILGSGTQVFADFYAYAMDYNNPASYWYDANTDIQHQVYTGGVMDFYYKDALDQYHRFASYEDSTVHALVDYIGNADTWIWSGTNVAVNDVLLPASVSFGTAIAVNTSGIILSELETDPYVGFFDVRTRSMTVNFNELNATLVPEPSRAVLLLGGLPGMWGRRRR
ncbi:MAG TPA: hypothetical protein DDZ88_25050 [Verrucomicrobiales bacterium]|nr:hypothetical protein [Verrucomicrobiales bacterium]